MSEQYVVLMMCVCVCMHPSLFEIVILVHGYGQAKSANDYSSRNSSIEVSQR